MKEQEKRTVIYARLESMIGREMALFCLCAVYDIPYDPRSEAETWAEYESEIESGHTFSDGVTDANTVMLAGMETGERWSTVWGADYSESDYRQLDELYKTMTAQLDATGGIDRQQDDTARTCAMMALQRNKLIRSKNKDDIAMAKNLDDMIRKNLQDANMRKADILPNAQQRPDGFVDALKKKYGLTMEMTKDDVMQAFFNWCRSKKYPETVDAEEHAMMAILRTIQKNDDLPEPADLPDDMSLAAFEHQFAAEPNEMEADAYEYLHLVRGEFKRDED